MTCIEKEMVVCFYSCFECSKESIKDNSITNSMIELLLMIHVVINTAF